MRFYLGLFRFTRHIMLIPYRGERSLYVIRLSTIVRTYSSLFILGPHRITIFQEITCEGSLLSSRKLTALISLQPFTITCVWVIINYRLPLRDITIHWAWVMNLWWTEQKPKPIWVTCTSKTTFNLNLYKKIRKSLVYRWETVWYQR